MDNQSLGIGLTLVVACMLLMSRHLVLRIGRDGWDPRRLTAGWNLLAGRLALLVQTKRTQDHATPSNARTSNAALSGRLHQARNYREVPDASGRRPRVISAHHHF
jgi:hypothetical protein